MAHKSQPPSPLYLKKPNHLVSAFSKVTSFTPKNSPLRSASPFTSSNSMSPQQLPRINHAKSALGQYARASSIQRSATKGESSLFEGHITNLEEGDKKAAIKFGKVMQLNKVTIEDKKEESRERYLMAKKYMKELKQVRIYEDKEGRMYNKKKMLDESERVIKLSENFFVTMNIRIKVMSDMLSDSAMTIFPVEERQELAVFYQMLVPEVCDFPYSLIAKLKIFLVTICSEASLYSPIYINILEQKMKNGLFVLKDLETQEAVRDYWYKIVAWHFVKAEPTMYEEWKEFVRNENAALFLRKSDLKGEMEELMITFRCVIRPQDAANSGVPNVQQKMKFLRKQLKTFEPICFDEGWWDMKYNDDLYHK